MKKIVVFLLPVLLIIACNDKEIVIQPLPTHPQMKYTDMNNLSIQFGQHKTLNMDGDHTDDLLFSTMLVGDPIFRVDKRKYFVSAAFDVFLLINGGEETPALNAGDAITIQNHPGYNWFNANSPVLAEKIIEENGPDHWEGNWKNADHKYLPVQVRKNNLRYNGWVELSFNTGSGELILHRAAISLEAGKTVKAGQ
ncbi:MAG: hypothetical protein WDO71_11255 [Bacteroidota bacterium]